MTKNRMENLYFISNNRTGGFNRHVSVIFIYIFLKINTL